MNWLRNLLREWLCGELDLRLKDVERHFVTKRDPETGTPTETLADVPLEKRKELKPSTRGMSWAQRKAFLERTDGGRIV